MSLRSASPARRNATKLDLPRFPLRYSVTSIRAW